MFQYWNTDEKNNTHFQFSICTILEQRNFNGKYSYLLITIARRNCWENVSICENLLLLLLTTTKTVICKLL